MGSLNQVTLIGNLGRDAELRYTQGGAAVANFTMATTETWKDKDGQKKEDTQWHRVVVWGKTAEALQDYLTKGKSVCVVGKLVTRKWTDKEGVEKYTTEIKADRVVLLGGKGEGGAQQRRSAQTQESDFNDAGRRAEVQEAGYDDAGTQEIRDLDDSDIPF